MKTYLKPNLLQEILGNIRQQEEDEHSAQEQLKALRAFAKRLGLLKAAVCITNIMDE